MSPSTDRIRVTNDEDKNVLKGYRSLLPETSYVDEDADKQQDIVEGCGFFDQVHSLPILCDQGESKSRFSTAGHGLSSVTVSTLARSPCLGCSTIS